MRWLGAILPAGNCVAQNRRHRRALHVRAWYQQAACPFHAAPHLRIDLTAVDSTRLRSEPERTNPQGEESRSPQGGLQGAVSYGHAGSIVGSGVPAAAKCASISSMYWLKRPTGIRFVLFGTGPKGVSTTPQKADARM